VFFTRSLLLMGSQQIYLNSHLSAELLNKSEQNLSA